MAGDTANPRIWLGADVYVGAVGTTAPVDVTTTLNVAFKFVGLLSEDGMTHGREQDQTEHWAYGNILVRVTRGRYKETLAVTCLEDNPVVFDLRYPGSTAVTSAGPTPPAGVTTREIHVPGVNPKAGVVALVDGTVKSRLAIPKFEVTEVGESTISDNGMESFPLTFTIYPSAAGVLYTEITTNPAAVVA